MPVTDITIHENADIPIWIQIRNRIVYLIRTGRYVQGDRLPSVRELAVELNINFNTVSKAYQALEREGFIKTMRGRGTFVSDPPEGAAEEESPLDVLIEALMKAADSAGVDNDELLFRIEARLERRGENHGNA